MIRSTIHSLIENPESDEMFEALCGDDESAFLVDWREDDGDIPRYCESILFTEMLSGVWEDDRLFIQFGQKRVQVPLTHSAADRHITLVTLNEVLHPDFEVRYAVQSRGSDGLIVVPLPAS